MPTGSGYYLDQTTWRLFAGAGYSGNGGGGGPIDTFVLGTTKPSATNTGVGIIAPAPTRVWQGDLTTSVAGDLIENLIITGRLIARADGITAQNCEILVGTANSQGTAFGIDTTRATNFTSRFNTIHATTTSVWPAGIGPNNFTSERDHIYDVVDGYDIFHATGGTINVQGLGTYIHGLQLVTPDPNHPNDVPVSKTHCDGIQLQGGTGGYFKGMNIESLASTTYSSASLLVNHPQALSALMFTPITGPIRGVTFIDGWLSGGEITVNIGGATNNTQASSGVVQRNRIGRNQYLSNAAIVVARAGVPGVDLGSGANVNVYEDTLTSVTINRNG